MNNQEYEQKKRECWEEYKRTNLDGEVQWQPVSRYDVFCAAFGRAYALGKKIGISEQVDAEGEEMLTVPRKRVEKIFVGQMEVQKCSPLETIIHCEAAAKTELLYTLFGSKCLPANVESSEPNVDSLPQNPTENCDNESHISTDCSKPAEPKFKPNDKVIFENVVCTIMQVCYEDSTYSLMKDKTGAFVAWIAESDLEPYTEPTDFGRDANFPTKNNLAIYLKKSKNCDNRLQIAAMAMQGILSNIDLFKNALETGTEILSGDGIPYRAVAKASLLFADALIAESEKK